MKPLLLWVVAALVASLVAGCAPQTEPLQTQEPELPAAYRETPASTFPTDLGTIDHVEAEGGRIVAARYQDAALTLLESDGTRLWSRQFPGMMITSVKLAPSGDRVFVSLLPPSMVGIAQAVWFDESGTALWQREADLKGGMYDANIAENGRALALYVLPSGLESSGLPAFELVDDSGQTSWEAEPAEGAVVCVRSSLNLERHAVTMDSRSAPSDETPASTTIVRYEDGRQAMRHVTAGVPTTVYLDESGSKLLSVADGVELSLQSLDSTTALWQTRGDFVSHAVISEDGSTLLTAGFSSTQLGDETTYVVELALRDMESGELIWETRREGDSGCWPSTNANLTRITLVPWSSGQPSLLFERSGSEWRSWSLPSQMRAAGFTPEGHLILGSADGSIALY
ncbi:MAG: hypothetical protein CVT66_10810 [Actinobacteria bacterium HGW-Actinobacteria-6]|jgi:hypothetical protein|nr:MAG: hypothetical protein CVU63_01080 [Deltaproteobacteria bacterium HGW-Deltaproteobacteria-20]PKQ19310.1 MAG: hypothetical protein CVT66_10810 [Actinobacteria bacterium HGW-Actinobacteria-6]